MIASGRDHQAESRALALAIGLPAALLIGAYISQYVFGLYPCEMCWWQRWPHFAALGLALAAAAFRPSRRMLIGLAGTAILVSGLIGAFHAGVEYGWWEGFTSCSSAVDPNADPMEAIMNTPLVRCDVAQWSLFNISLAGWNFLFSTGGALMIFRLLARGSRR